MALKKTAIIGAGPMGLVCAWKLAKAGVPVTVFEKDAVPGGMSASFNFDGVQIERYYHFINLPDQTLFDLLKELDLYDQLRWQNTKMGFYRKDSDNVNRLHPWGNPVALLALKDAPLVARLRYGLHAYKCKYLKSLDQLDDISAKDWIVKNEGSDGYRLFWSFLFEKKFFEFSDPLSAAWIASRIRRVANSRKSLMTEQLGYLEGGSASLVDHLIRQIREYGGEIRLSEPVKKIWKETNGNYGVETDADIAYYENLVSTIPLPYLEGLIPDLPEEYKKRASQVRNVGCACTLFRLDRKLTENFWLNVDVPEWDFPGIIEYSNLRPMNKAYVYVPFYMPHTHPNWTKSDDELLNQARMALRAVNAEAAQTEENAVLFRYEYAQPVCQPGFRHILPPIRTGLPGLLAADTAHSFPEDRSINDSARIGARLAETLLESA